ncbi:uncharacterized protein MELLADRAFT_114397 [Melampsora larici-populina 98AG31]|uniref:Uncharacterized protein n=1 Tax=Melampsora larici-populina (strain 98AG31 / pathotype 3-4-7) TaxID=747676 RepID=F4SDA8_MELLP|nr:uncharacterized protein MELLADRAFT_114397 [Melampsora larici-populina 98AG31]EGF97366.1 hypothetical protein MELLADRAFT_114397 [Melampsora larici-populina 98AG31]
MITTSVPPEGPSKSNTKATPVIKINPSPEADTTRDNNRFLNSEPNMSLSPPSSNHRKGQRRTYINDSEDFNKTDQSKRREVPNPDVMQEDIGQPDVENINPGELLSNLSLFESDLNHELTTYLINDARNSSW